jgi:hypothetical protein
VHAVLVAVEIGLLRDGVVVDLRHHQLVRVHRAQEAFFVGARSSGKARIFN